MPKAKLFDNSVPRVELDQRARDARLQLEHVERLLAPRHAMAAYWLRRVLFRFSFGTFGDRARGSRTRGLPSNRRPSRTPRIHQIRSPARGAFCRAS